MELAQPSLEEDTATNAQEPNNAPLDLPVALQGFRMYKIGSLDPNHVSDQQDLLYYLHRRPLFLDQAQQLTEAWERCKPISFQNLDFETLDFNSLAHVGFQRSIIVPKQIQRL